MPTIKQQLGDQMEVPKKYVRKPTKRCTRCNEEKELTDFYTNREFDAQQGRDAWCKTCVLQCATKEAMQKYFWENNRAWSDGLWNHVMKQAEQKLANNPTFIKLSDPMKTVAMERVACGLVPTYMGAKGHYVYEEHNVEAQEIDPDDPANDKTPRYSKEFNGYFKRNELEYLRNYYQGLEEDFELNDTNIRDVAKKLAKASLQADKAQNDYMSGRCDYSVVKDAISQFDLLSKSGNFAACKRKPGENTGLGSWAEITLKLEQTGHPCTRKIEWEPDDVDKVLAEFQHLSEALALDTV